MVVLGGRVVGTWDADGEPAWFSDERIPSPAALAAGRARRPAQAPP